MFDVLFFFFFFFNDTATTEIYTLSLHDALPISRSVIDSLTAASLLREQRVDRFVDIGSGDRKSTRLNSSHVETSYAVFCYKKKINKHRGPIQPRQHDKTARHILVAATD